MGKFTVKTIVATGIGAAIFFLLARFVSIPIFANTYLSFQYAVLGFFAAVFGPIAGLLIAFIGHALSDFTGYGLWWSWIITSGIVGFVSGLILKNHKIEEGVFSKKDIVRFVIGSLLIHIVAWTVIAAPLDILIYAEPVAKSFTQGLLAGATNGVITAVIGALLIHFYSMTRTRTGSLSKD